MPERETLALVGAAVPTFDVGGQRDPHDAIITSRQFAAAGAQVQCDVDIQVDSLYEFYATGLITVRGASGTLRILDLFIIRSGSPTIQVDLDLVESNAQGNVTARVGPHRWFLRAGDKVRATINASGLAGETCTGFLAVRRIA